MGGAGGALLFAVHPVHAQPVAYVSARADLLCGALTAGSFLAYLTAWGERGLRRSPLVLSVLLFVLALLSKEVGFVLPVLIGVHLWQRGEVRGRALAALLPYAAVAGGALALRVLVLERQTWAPADLVTRLATTGFTMGENLKHVLLPWTLKVFNHADPRSSLSDPAVIGGWAAFLLLLALAVAAVRRAKVPALGGLWFFAALLPVSGLVAIVHPSMVADRFLYLPMLGLGVAAAGSLEGVARSWRRLPLRGAVAAAIAAASVGCAFASADRVANWRDSVSLWTRATTDQSGSGYAFTNLGSALAEEGRLGEAEAAYRSALCLGGDRGLIYCNLGWISLDRGNITGASDYARLSLEASPRNVGATLLLAECHRMRGEPGRAVALLQEARRLNPYDGRLREILRGLPAEAL